MSVLRWKGELADGHVHMTAHEYVEHRTKENHERQRQILRKLSGNPILTDEIRMAVRYAVYILDDNDFYRKQVSELREEIDNMKKARPLNEARKPI